MAFCPHCGKSVTEQAAKCAACNGELEPRGKAARFKGTMMMSPGTAPLIQPPNAGQPRNTAPGAQPAAAAAPAASVPSGTAATMPMPAAGPIADAAATAAAKKPAALKATMMGTGDGGLSDILKKVQQPAPAPAAAAAAPPAPAHTPMPTPMPPSEPAPAREPAAATRREVQADEDSKRFLVGDPMAPKGGSEAPAAAPKPQRNVPRISEDMSTELPKDRSATIIVVGIIGVCVIAAIGYVAAKLMGLTN